MLLPNKFSQWSNFVTLWLKFINSRLKSSSNSPPSKNSTALMVRFSSSSENVNLFSLPAWASLLCIASLRRRFFLFLFFAWSNKGACFSLKINILVSQKIKNKSILNYFITIILGFDCSNKIISYTHYFVAQAEVVQLQNFALKICYLYIENSSNWVESFLIFSPLSKN